MQLEYDTFKVAAQRAGRDKDGRDFPSRSDKRTSGGSIFPRIHPKFRLDFSRAPKVFTIGSCFARNIEGPLARHGAVLPTRSFTVRPGEFVEPLYSLLNEYNPGTMAQRILSGLTGRTFPEASIVPSGADKYADLLLPGIPQKSKYDVSYERALERRREFDALYAEIATSNLVILTLGFVEAWFDTQTNLFLNRLPPVHFTMANPDRFRFVRMGVEECMRQLGPAISALSAAGVPTLITVSPVPIHTTFSGEDCAVANEFSKSVLRVCADNLCRSYENVDYFPSYEIVRSGGLSNYEDDGIHVKTSVIEPVTDYMVTAYASSDIAGNPQS